MSWCSQIARSPGEDTERWDISLLIASVSVEEKLLIKFFGDDYIQYRKEVPTRILFIR